MDKQEKILSLVKAQGPLLPSSINKVIDVNVLFASAMLSELVDRKQLKLSSAKIGGSPVYYCVGQEAKLSMLYKYLHEKDRRAYDLLIKKEVLRSSSLTPLERASLANIKDFAFPLEVTHDGTTEIFWKWHLISDENAEIIIKQLLGMNKPVEKQVETPVEQSIEQPIVETQVVKEPKPSIPVNSKVETTFQSEQPIVKESNPIPVHVPEVSKEKIIPTETLSQTLKNNDSTSLRQASKSLPKKVKENNIIPKQKHESQTPLTDVSPSEFPMGDELFVLVKTFCDANHLKIRNFKIIRKGSDIDLTIAVPTNIGNINFYSKAKKKQKLNDSDLSSIFITGQMNKSPILVLTTGDLTKKAQLLLDSEFKLMVVKKLS